jgi:hypothetical protein
MQKWEARILCQRGLAVQGGVSSSVSSFLISVRFGAFLLPYKKANEVAAYGMNTGFFVSVLLSASLCAMELSDEKRRDRAAPS